jgi:mRNA interferase RelE/StbE
MPTLVELVDEAVEDLGRYAETGNLQLFLKKLLRLEQYGKDAGLPLGGSLTGWRKIVVGDRNWRIIFTTNVQETVATVWVIGDREDSVCYDEAQRRIAALGPARPEVATLASVMFQLMEMQRARKKAKRRR